MKGSPDISSTQIVPAGDAAPSGRWGFLKTGVNRAIDFVRAKIGRQVEIPQPGGSPFNFERWINPDTDTTFKQTHRILKRKGYVDENNNPFVTSAICFGSEDISKFGFRRNREGMWSRSKEGRPVELGAQEISSLETAISSLSPEVVELTRDRIFMRYILMREEMYGYSPDNQGDQGVRFMENNPQLLQLITDACVAREAKGAGLEFNRWAGKMNKYQKWDAEKAEDIHARAVWQEIAEKLPPRRSLNLS